LNYRFSELQAACALAQLTKLQDIVTARQQSASRMHSLLSDVLGITLPMASQSSEHVYWKYPLLIDETIIENGSVGLSKLLKENQIASAPRYIQKPAFRCQVFREQRTFGNSRWPFTLAQPEAVNYQEACFPGTFKYLERVLVLPWNEKYTNEHVDYLASCINAAAQRLTQGVTV
jgi:dTDP-4-amino-4,6-dideoxygalactose transaminase